MSTGNANGGVPGSDSHQGEQRRPSAVTWAYRAILTLISAMVLLLILVVTRTPDYPQPQGQPAEPVRVSGSEVGQRVNKRLLEFLDRMRQDPLPETDQAIEEKINEAFAPVYDRIPEFLDWHYSIVGQYMELFLAAGEEEKLEKEIRSRLFVKLQERIGTATQEVDRVMQEEIVSQIEQWGLNESQALTLLGERTTYKRVLDTTVADALRRFKASAVPLSIVSVGTGTSSTVAVAILAKAVAKKVMASVALKTAGKVGGKVAVGGGFGGAATGAAIGSVLGPVGAAIGGVVGGVAAWLALDAVFVNVDELLNRKDLKRELIELIDKQKAQVKSVMLKAVNENKHEALGILTPSELRDRDSSRSGGRQLHRQ